MGTNYYLRVKGKSIDKVEDFPRLSDEKITVLNNGVVWQNHYYPSMEVLRNSPEYCITLHIGKNSAGWNFGMRTYSSHGIKTLDDWKKFFALPDSYIVDECDDKISTELFLEIITQKKVAKWDEYSSAAEYEAASVKRWNNHYNEEEEEDKKTGYPVFRMYTHPVKNYDDILRDYGAVRGGRGLLGRKSDQYFTIIHIEGESYDLIFENEEDNYSW